MSREKEMPEAEARLRNSIDRRVSTSRKVLASNRLVSIGILPNVNSRKLNRDVSSAQRHIPHWKVHEQPNKKPKNGDDMSGYCEKCTTVELVNWMSWICFCLVRMRTWTYL